MLSLHIASVSKRFGLLLLIAGLSFGLSSCANFHMGYVQGSAQLTERNFTENGQATGEAKATYWLGIGGNKKDNLVELAWQDMRKKYPLKEGQAYANVRQNTTQRRVLGYFYMRRTLTISADIVTFQPEAD